MAQVQLPPHTHQRVRRYADSHSPGKENIPPTWAKSTPHSSIKKHHHHDHHDHRKDRKDRKDRTAREVLAPLPAGILKSAVAKQGFFQQFGKNIRRQNSSDDPLRVRPGFFAKYRQDEVQEQSLDMGFSEAAHTYCKSAASHLEQRHADHAQSLTTLRTGLDINNNPIPPRPGVPTPADFDALTSQRSLLDRDIVEELVHVKFCRPDGVSPSVRPLRLGTTLEVLRKRKDEKQARNAELESELRAVKVEMERLVREIEGDCEVTREAEGAFRREMEGFGKEGEECERKAKRGMREVKREEDEVVERFNRKVEELFLMASAVRS